MRSAIAFPVYRLNASGYSKPQGALGLIERDGGLALTVRWLPPHSGLSSGISPSEMDLVPGVELTIPLELIDAAIEHGDRETRGGDLFHRQAPPRADR